MRARWLYFLAAAGLWTAAGRAVANPAIWETVRGQPILDVQIQTGDVFDPTQPNENYFYCRWANALHIRTRTSVIERELLFARGDAFDPERVAETARNLRDLDIFQEVEIVPEETAGGLVVHVRTHDRWTTELRTQFSRQGGISEVGIGLSDVNLLGRAYELGGSVTSSSDVDAASVRWRDPRLFGTRWVASASLRRDDLENNDQYGLDLPFFSDTARYTAALSYSVANGERRQFDAGEEVGRVALDDHLADGFGAYHDVEGRLRRFGVLTSLRRRGGDEPEDAAVVAVAWSMLERHYDVVRDIDLMGAVEDIATGLTVQVGGGADLKALGASQNRTFVRADVGWARDLGPNSHIGCELRQYAFLVKGFDVDNARVAFEAYGYWQTWGLQTFAWRAGLGVLQGEPVALRFNLGGDDRLRGYEARHISGDRVMYGSIEERIFTPWRFFFLRMGAVFFMDAAAVWDGGEPLSSEQARIGGGFGLRVASNRAGSSLAGIDFAFGAGSFQISFASQQAFNVARGLSYLDPRPFR